MKLHVQECPNCARIRIQLDGEREWSGWFPKKAHKLERHHEIASFVHVDCGNCPAQRIQFPAPHGAGSETR